MMKLNKKQKAAVERWCYLELADIIDEADYGDPFKDRYETQPDEVNNLDDSPEGEEIADAADDLFFVVMKKLAKEFRKRVRA